MYLINTKSLAIEFFQESDQVPYAILSHRWEREEVTLQDMQNGTAIGKYGYYKIQKTCEKAQQYDLEYAWVDTCCIDKTSSAELSEAINSMFEWYRSAMVCFVYLSDVDTLSNMKNSEWFTRGWTLQELIAPAEMVFFNDSWTELGTKYSLKPILAARTGIPMRILAGDNFMRQSIAQRMSWAAKRKTTRREDRAYSLMGIFGINMPLLYGEGNKAFIRLQEEIIKGTDDQTIFAWTLQGDDDTAEGLLAHSPEAFSECSNIVPRWQALHLSTFAITNRGLYIQLPIIQWSYNIMVALLNCSDGREGSDTVGILIRSLHEQDQYARVVLCGRDRILFKKECFRGRRVVFERDPRAVHAAFNDPLRKSPLLLSHTSVESVPVAQVYVIRPASVYFRQTPCNFALPDPKKTYGFWLRKFRPFQKHKSLDVDVDFSIRSWNEWNFEERRAHIPEGCYGAAFIIYIRGKAMSSSFEAGGIDFDSIDFAPISWGTMTMPSMLFTLGFQYNYEVIGALKTGLNSQDLLFATDPRSDDLVLSEDPWLRFDAGFTKKPGKDLLVRESNWNLYISTELVDGIETHVVDLLWSGQRSQCDECGKILTVWQYCCLYCEQYDVCVSCFKVISKTRHDAEEERKQHRFRLITLRRASLRDRRKYGTEETDKDPILQHPRLLP